MGWKRRRVEAMQSGGSEAGEEGGSEGEDEGGKEGGSEAGWKKRGLTLRTRGGIRAVEFQPDFKTIQVWSNM